MDQETKERLIDFFTSAELVEYLALPVREIIERFEDEISEALDDIEELMNVKH
jgi:hypothetical protein